MVRKPLRHHACVVALCALLSPATAVADDQTAATIARIKPSVVAVGTFARKRNPKFSFAGTGFAVADGRHVATNEHVLPRQLDRDGDETLAIAVRKSGNAVEIRPARKVAADAAHDLAVLELHGDPLPALRLGDSLRVREGETYVFTGYPIGAVLGLYPASHRAMIAAVTPIAIPAARAEQLDARTVRRLVSGPFDVFQLDATAYPGNSGSPVYRPHTGEVVGIVNSVLVKSTRESALAAPSGITYAIPSQKLLELLEKIR